MPYSDVRIWQLPRHHRYGGGVAVTRTRHHEGNLLGLYLRGLIFLLLFLMLAAVFLSVLAGGWFCHGCLCIGGYGFGPLLKSCLIGGFFF